MYPVPAQTTPPVRVTTSAKFGMLRAMVTTTITRASRITVELFNKNHKQLVIAEPIAVYQRELLEFRTILAFPLAHFSAR